MVKALHTPEAAPSLGSMVLPAGEDSGASTSFPQPEWETALSLPDNVAAPQPLRSHVEEELRILLNIGRKKCLSDSLFHKSIEPLALNEASVGFLKALLQRVNDLQLEHYNGGEHLPFYFSSAREKNRLYSIMWGKSD